MSTPTVTYPPPAESAQGQQLPQTASYSYPSKYDKQPTNLPSSRQPGLKSAANHRVPVHTNLPTTVPSDLVPPTATWQVAQHVPYTIHPTAWRTVSSSGPAPFYPTEVVYQLPASGTLLSWESRPFRRQTEQSLLSNIPSSVAERRAALHLPWYKRLIKVDLRRWSWWAVLNFNIGSHALVYAGVCLFIDYFNTDNGVYEANTGWSSNFLAACFWLAACFCEIMALATENESGKWYTRPTPLLPRNQRKVDPHVYDCQYIDRITPRSSVGMLLRRIDVWIVALRLVGVLAFTVAAVAFSGAFTNLSWAAQIGAVFVMYIVAAACFLAAAILTLAECCHSWVPLRRGSLYQSITSLEWLSSVLYILGSLSLLAYAITLWKEPSLLDQRQGPAIPYLIFACLFTVMDWLHAVEQGERCEFEMGPNQQTEPATHAMPQQQLTANGVAETTVVGAPNGTLVSSAEESQANDYRVDIRSPRHLQTVAV